MKILFIAMLCAISVVAQEQQRAVELKHVTAKDIGGLLMNTVRMNHDQSGKFLILGGTTENLAVAEALIKRIDVPKRTLELTFHILSDGNPEASKIPAELEPVVKQLRSSFSYSDYKLLETAFVRAREGGTFEAVGMVGSGEYRIAANRPLEVNQSDGKIYVKTDTLLFHLGGKQAAHLSAPLDIRDGQKVVIGKSSASSVSGAVFLVVSAKVVD